MTDLELKIERVLTKVREADGDIDFSMILIHPLDTPKCMIGKEANFFFCGQKIPMYTDLSATRGQIIVRKKCAICEDAGS